MPFHEKKLNGAESTALDWIMTKRSSANAMIEEREQRIDQLTAEIERLIADRDEHVARVFERELGLPNPNEVDLGIEGEIGAYTVSWETQPAPEAAPPAPEDPEAPEAPEVASKAEDEASSEAA